VDGAIFLARRNLRLGRGDRRGAFIATFVFSAIILSWVFGSPRRVRTGPHVPALL
jgi:hypothetical protein